MFLIAAAMKEEIQIGLEFCRNVRQTPDAPISLWEGTTCNGTQLYFLKTGVGPEKSAAAVRKAVEWKTPERILVVGYAGALDASLKLGDLVAVTKASSFRLDKNCQDWNPVPDDGIFHLADAGKLEESAKNAGMNVLTGSILSSSYVLGKPEHKELLSRRFQASVVDMETAFIARAAAEKNIPISCMRAVSDTAQDTFLEPFSHDPAMSLVDRAGKLLGNGMAQTYRDWKSHSAIAKESLRRFMEKWLQSK